MSCYDSSGWFTLRWDSQRGLTDRIGWENTTKTHITKVWKECVTSKQLDRTIKSLLITFTSGLQLRWILKCHRNILKATDTSCTQRAEDQNPSTAELITNYTFLKWRCIASFFPLRVEMQENRGEIMQNCRNCRYHCRNCGHQIPPPPRVHPKPPKNDNSECKLKQHRWNYRQAIPATQGWCTLRNSSWCTIHTQQWPPHHSLCTCAVRRRMSHMLAKQKRGQHTVG